MMNDLDPGSQTLILDPAHPGIDDPHYVARRQLFFDVARKHRLNQLGLPHLEYTPTEHQIWRHVSEQLAQAHQAKACAIYLQGKQRLGLETQRMPQLHELDARLRQQHNICLMAAEGLIEVRAFFDYLSQRIMPCTQYLRHPSNPEYTPEPDAVHDVIGHVPPLMVREYVELIQLIGQGVQQATEQELLAWQKIYWFTIEFGLIEEGSELRAFGAGLLSSFGEMEHAFSNQVTRKPFVLDEVITTEFDTNKMQDILFVIPSLAVLHREITRFSSALGI